jgi:hypothetical protein
VFEWDSNTLVVNSSASSVGIGIATPSDIKLFHILDGTTRNVATIGDAPGMKLTSRLDTVGERLEINFESLTSQSYGTASIGIVHDNTVNHETSSLFFATKSGTGSSDRPIERLRITSSGDITIAAGGDLETSTTGKIKQKGAFMQSSTHQALALGG